MITGAFIRVERDGKFRDVDIVECTRDELRAYEERCPDGGYAWVRFLVNWIQENI